MGWGGRHICNKVAKPELGAEKTSCEGGPGGAQCERVFQVWELESQQGEEWSLWNGLAWASDLGRADGGIHTEADWVRLSEPECREEGIHAGRDSNKDDCQGLMKDNGR